VTLGQRGYGRALLAGSPGLAGGNLLYASESAHNDGPWRIPEKFHRSNGVLRYSVVDGAARWTLTGMAYAAGWNATDQVPRRAVDAGLVDRFGAIDSTDGGQAARHSLSAAWQRRVPGGEWTGSAYLVHSRLDLFSNFTYFLDDRAGDQFEQAERRTLAGGALGRRWTTTVGGREGSTTVGVQVRQDRIHPVGLYATTGRARTATVLESQVRETSWALYARNDTQWTGWLRSIAGVRADRFAFDVASPTTQDGGRRDATILTPKLSLVAGPWRSTEFFLNAGHGFHSNDARGTLPRLAPRGVLPANAVTPLVRSRGAELGVRTDIVPGLQSSFAAWWLKLASELVFVGDAGDTEASRASRRHGIEWSNHYQATPWLLLDADLALARARFTPDDPAGNAIPGAVDRVASLGATVTRLGPWFGQFQLRHVGPRPLVEDRSRRSASTTLASLRVGYRLTPQTRVVVDVFNLFDRKASDIDYFYTSRLRGEPAGGVDDIHFHPAEPRSVRMTLSHRF
ncbi:MAG TPA: TonB-dependent receptor, partial [Ramlibacter sp.]